MGKEKKIIGYFIGWLVIFIFICFIGISNVFAEEIAYSNSTFRVRECGSEDWTSWTSASQKLAVESVDRVGVRFYFNNTQLNANTYYNISLNYNYYTEAPSLNVLKEYTKTTFYYNTIASETGEISGNINNYSVRFEKDSENPNIIKAVYNVLIPANSKFISFNIRWSTPNANTCRTLAEGFTISDIKIESLNDTNAIIDSNNQNTDNIISNDNQNTQAIIDSNKETQEVIKDQFNNCRDSYNLFNIANVQTNNWVTNQGETLLIRGLYAAYTQKSLKQLAPNLEIGKSYYLQLKNSVNKNLYIYLSGENIGWYNNQSLQITQEILDSYVIFYGEENQDVIISDIMISEKNVPYEPYGEEVCSNKIDETNDKLDNITGAITDESSPNLRGLENSAGWLPAGPVDSILNLPLTMLNSLTNSLGKTCSPLNVELPFVKTNIQIPCLSSIFNEIEGANELWTWAGAIASVLILYNYLLNLYAWVDRVLTLRAEFDEAMGADLANWGRL